MITPSFRAFVFILFLAWAAPVYASFSDVAQNHANSVAIAYVQKQKIMNGYNDGSFKPDQKVNRAEFYKTVALNRFGQEMIDKCATPMFFSDVDESSAWYTKYLCRLKDASVIGGSETSPGHPFGPSHPVSFTEAAEAIMILDTFDEDRRSWVRPTYESCGRYLSDHHAIPRSILKSRHYISRGELAEIIYRLNEKIIDKPSMTYDELKS